MHACFRCVAFSPAALAPAAASRMPPNLHVLPPYRQGVLCGAVCRRAAGAQPSLAVRRRGGLGAGHGAEPSGHGVSVLLRKGVVGAASLLGRLVPLAWLVLDPPAAAAAAAFPVGYLRRRPAPFPAPALQAALPLGRAGGAAAGGADHWPAHAGGCGPHAALGVLQLLEPSAGIAVAIFFPSLAAPYCCSSSTARQGLWFCSGTARRRTRSSCSCCTTH